MTDCSQPIFHFGHLDCCVVGQLFFEAKGVVLALRAKVRAY